MATLPAQAILASCFTGATSTITFNWTNSKATLVAGSIGTAPPLLSLDSSRAALRDLRLPGAPLTLGVMYTLRVAGCYTVTPAVCGSAETDVFLLDEPLGGGIKGADRTVGQDSELFLDGCHSKDPDEPTAQCNAAGECGTLRFAWRCTPVEDSPACLAEPPAETVCAWSIAAGAMPAGNFSFELVVSNTAQAADSLKVRATVKVTVVAGTLPSVLITELALAKQPPADKLRLTSAAAMPGQPASALTYEWAVDDASLDLSSTAVSTTSNTRPNLALLPGMLRAGAEYTFTLVASFQGRSASASMRVKMNSAPYGGSMSLSPEANFIALTTDITLTAIQWTDDASDMPLEYAFSYTNSDAVALATSQGYWGFVDTWRALGKATLSGTYV